MSSLAVKRVFLGLLISLCFSSYVSGRSVLEIQRAAICLYKKKFLSMANRYYSFGYIIDNKSFPGKEVIYVVNYNNKLAVDGKIFLIFLNDNREKQLLNIQNNAEFSISTNVNGGVYFKTPPLGGAWAQSHLVAAIKMIEKRPRINISAQDLLTMKAGFGCVSYTDPVGTVSSNVP